MESDSGAATLDHRGQGGLLCEELRELSHENLRGGMCQADEIAKGLVWLQYTRGGDSVCLGGIS